MSIYEIITVKLAELIAQRFSADDAASMTDENLAALMASYFDEEYGDWDNDPRSREHVGPFFGPRPDRETWEPQRSEIEAVRRHLTLETWGADDACAY
tara:strand:+ start:417 stop:710 length:294 start_codon:yes stop_codon:yes gene_type:complete